jgi:hypothetical protein
MKAPIFFRFFRVFLEKKSLAKNQINFIKLRKPNTKILLVLFPVIIFFLVFLGFGKGSENQIKFENEAFPKWQTYIEFAKRLQGGCKITYRDKNLDNIFG